MSSDELRDAIAGALYVRDRFDSPTVVLADAILALPEMQAMLAKDAEVERLRAALVAIQDEANTFGEGCACSDVYVRRLDRVWEMAHNALTEEARRG